jgi:hypothetical protein
MRPRMVGKIAGALCALSFPFLLAGASSAAPGDKVAPNDVQTTFFTGMPFTASTPQSIKYTMVFTADGKVTREPQGKTGVKGDGTWKLSKDGFCTTWKNSPANCFQLVVAGDNKWSVMKGTALVGTWSK